mgnify:CR=1 FL=1
MSYTYTTLTQAIKDYANTDETTFNNNINNFITSAEDRILRTCQLPNFRKNVEGQMSSGTQYLSTPSDFLAPFSLSVTSNSKQSFLLLKEVAFLREAYPNATTEGEPKYYALFDDDTFMLAPTPNGVYTIEMWYEETPERLGNGSGTTSTTTFVSNTAPEVLLYKCVAEAYSYLKNPTDMQIYDQKFQVALQAYANEQMGLKRRDEYTDGVLRIPLKSANPDGGN